MTESATGSRPRVAIVVDDEKVIAMTLAIILKRAGFDAHAMSSGRQVLDSLETLQPDLLISDVVMPKMNGIELAAIVRSKLPTCRILLFSGQAVTFDLLEEAHLDHHEFEVLQKPIHPTDLLAKLQNG
jgi:CheY-like chemotaxis protein